MMSRSTFMRMLRDRGGNFGMMTAVLLPVTIGVGGMAIDFTNVLQQKANIQAIADAATLAAASKMSKDDITEAEAEAISTNFLVSQALIELEQSGATAEEIAAEKAALLASTSTEAEVTPTGGSSKSFDVSMTTTFNVKLNPLTRILGFESVPISISSVAASAREGNALSMYLVLDRSGSMAWDTTTVDPVNPTKSEEYTTICYDRRGNGYWCTQTRQVTNYVTKIAALKSAANVMFTELLKAAAPDATTVAAREAEAKNLIRVGAVSYTHQTQKEKKPAWGTTEAATYVTDLPAVPTGGTDASGAMSIAFDDLKKANATEKTEHAAKENHSFARFIVLMTDGEMTGNSGNWNRGIDEKVRRECDKAKADDIIIFTVAFMAPDNGKSLLSACASNEDNYYEASDMTALVTAFGDIGRKAAKTATRLTN
jgi:Flp pilus assembly protein TadG